MSRCRRTGLLVLAVSLAACASPSDRKLHLERDRFYLRAGGQVFANFDTEARVNSSSGNGTSVGLEGDLGLDDDTSTGRIDADLRLGSRHHVLASYYSIHRSAGSSINKTIEFQDVTFMVGASVAASLEMDIVKAAYRYDVWRDRRAEVGLSLGLHTLLIDLELAGEAAVSGGGGGGSGRVERSADVPAPLPMLGAHLRWLLADDWILSSDFQFFGLEFDDFEGFMNDSYLALEWRFSNHVGIGLAYNHFLIDLGLTDDDYTGDLEYTYNGLLFFLSGWV